jgi:hypothetical protein
MKCTEAVSKERRGFCDKALLRLDVARVDKPSPDGPIATPSFAAICLRL